MLMCTPIIQEKLFSMQLTCTWLKTSSNWKQCVNICTDEAKSMVGEKRHFIAHFKATAQNAHVGTIILLL